MTLSEENHLKAIFHLYAETKQAVSTNAIAEVMNTKASSVTDMLKKLAEKQLINYVKYQGVTLSKKGYQRAVSIIRKHRLWEVFLVEKLHFSWSEAHEQADGLEHQTSDMLAERLDEFLGHPEHCPHGDPIPKADGSRKGLTFRTLSDLKEGDNTTIRRIVEDYSLMDYLQEKGIHPDMRVTVKEKEPYEGPILLATEAGDISLSYKAVEQIFIDE